MLTLPAAASIAFTAFTTLSYADIINVEWATWEARGSNDDLLSFVTRPDLTPPRWEVKFFDRDETAPGYIFVAPYDCLSCSHQPTTTYVTQQIGPHIYTQDGDLVWSGIEQFPDRKVFDFQPLMIDGEPHLSLVLPHDEEWHPFADGAAILLNASYEPVNTLTSADIGHGIDLHEFNVIDEGRKALVSAKDVRDVTDADNIDWHQKVMECFFMEVDLRTQTQSFNWTASDHVKISDTSNPPPGHGEKQKHWDWFHLNSLDKDADGNYLVSARAMNAIYLVSTDGSIIWQLGGSNSSFAQDFDFSRQHHARIRKQSKKRMTISFFDNAADESGLWEPTSDSSSLCIVALDLEAMTATLAHRHSRPDGGLSQAKGNVQYLPNGGIFGGWGENAYVSEYSKPGGKMVYEASFASARFANYRAYKGDFVARPASIPVIKAFVSANSRGSLMTNIYVSWNGATEVALWRFYSHVGKNGRETMVPIGEIFKTGFETNYAAIGYHPITFAEAVDSYGNSLANSTLEITEVPAGFHDADAPMRTEAQRKRAAETEFVMRMICAFIAGIAFTIFWSRFQHGRHSFNWRPAFMDRTHKVA